MHIPRRLEPGKDSLLGHGEQVRERVKSQESTANSQQPRMKSQESEIKNQAGANGETVLIGAWPAEGWPKAAAGRPEAKGVLTLDS
jgi:hypothetical protein